MDAKDSLTNEKLGKKFKNQFDLVNYAIRLAENMIKTGRDPRVKIDMQNRAMQILAEINQNKDQFDEIPVEVPREDTRHENREYREHREPRHESRMNGKESFSEHSSKGTERKKGRKILAE